MTRMELVNQVSKLTGLEPHEVETSVMCFLRLVKKSLRDGDRVDIRGFGSFKPVLRKQKIGQNINKGVPIVIPEKKVVKFKPSKYFTI